MPRTRLKRNAIMSAVEVLMVAAAFFILYRVVLETIGAAGLGIWALVLTIASISRVTDLGVTGSVVKFVSKYLARGQQDVVSSIVQTAAISKGVVVGAVLLLAYPGIVALLEVLLPSEQFGMAVAILPQVLFAFWIHGFATVFQSGLDGCHRIALRNSLVIGTTLLNLALAVALLPTLGLMGLAYARIGQVSVLLLVTWIALRRCLPEVPWLPYRWDGGTFRELIGYGINFQIISIITALVEPLTKALLSAFGSTEMLGFYEMASRMVMQFRRLIVAANEAVVPLIADFQETNEAEIAALYQGSYQIVFYITVPSFAFLVAMTPLISEVWIGQFQGFFVYAAMLLCVAWSLNTLAGPAYFAGLGTGRLRLNVSGHIIIGLMNLCAGPLLGWLYGGVGVVVGFGISLSAGSLWIALRYNSQHGQGFSSLLPKESRLVVTLSCIGGLAASSVYFQFHDVWVVGTTAMLTVSIYCLFVLIPAWNHPVRRQLMNMLGGLTPRHGK